MSDDDKKTEPLENNQEIVDALVDPRKSVQERVSETEKATGKESADDSSAEDADKKEASKEDHSSAQITDLETAQEEIAYLKRKLGEQSGDVGEKRRRIEELEGTLEQLQTGGTTGKETDRQVTLLEQKLAVLRDKYPEDFTQDIVELVQAAVMPIQGRGVVSELRSKYDDFDTMVPEMERVMDANPALANAVKVNVSTVEDVYLIAKARKGLDSERRKGAAEAEQREREKREATVEQSGKRTSKEPHEPSPQEYNNAIAAQIAGARQPGRSV